MKRVLCLYRVSSLKQVQDNDIPLQRAETKAFIAKKASEGWVFCGEKLEKGISGYKNKVKDRDILIEILQMAEQHEFDILLVYMSDRLGRREDETPFYVAQLNQIGIEVWSVNEGQLKTEDHIDKLINYIRFWKAEGESRTTGIRVRDAQIEMIKQGKFAGGSIPFGYDLVYTGEINPKGKAVRKVVVNKEQAKIVYKIFDYVYSYGYGYKKIAIELNSSGISSPKGMKWNNTSVGNILKNPLYAGYFSYNKFFVDGRTQRQPRENWILSETPNQDLIIIPEGMFNKVQKIVDSRRIAAKGSQKNADAVLCGGSPQTTRGSLLLTGIIYCGYCQSRLTNGSNYNYWTTKDGIKHKKLVSRYKCVGYWSGKTPCGGMKSYAAEDIENIVKSEVSRYMAEIKSLDIIKEITLRNERLSEQKKRLQENYNQQSEKLKSDIQIMNEKVPDILRGEIDFPLNRLTELITEKEKAIESLTEDYKSQLSKLDIDDLEQADLKTISTLISDWDVQFNTAPIDIQKTMIRKVVKRVEVKKDSIRIELNIGIKDFLYRKKVDSETSMATPLVSGAIALLLEKYPDMSNRDVKLRLRERCTDLGLPQNQQGWGLLDVEKLLGE